MTAPSPQATAYSYLRLSSKRQLSGDGLRRQQELTQAFCAQHNLRLDDELVHIGSGFTGGNFKPGTALYEFVEKVKQGDVAQGSWLIVESLDRLSRNKVTRALNVFTQIIGSGITLATTLDGRIYTQKSVDDEPFELLGTIFILSRAAEESARKSDRLVQTWVAKRRKADVLTTKGPGWLRFEGVTDEYPSGWHHIPGRVASVRRIYELAADGVGCGKIARILNNPPEGVEYPTLSNISTAWYSGTVYPVIGNRAVLGHYQPHRLRKIEGTNQRGKRIPDGEEREGYYGPPIVSPALFQAAVTSTEGRALERPGNSGGRRGTKRSNLFTHLIVCAVCGGKMQYRPGGDRQKPYLQCAASRYSKCNNLHKPKYELVEGLILEEAINGRFDVPVNKNEARKIADEIAGTKDKILVKREAIKRLLTKFSSSDLGDDDIFVEHIREEKGKLESLEASLKSLEKIYEKLSSEDQKGRRRTALQMMRDEIANCKSDEEIFIVRTRVANILMGLIQVIYFDDVGGFIVIAYEPESLHYQARAIAGGAIEEDVGIKYFPEIKMADKLRYRNKYHGFTLSVKWMRYQSEVRTGRPWRETKAKMLSPDARGSATLLRDLPIFDQELIRREQAENPFNDPYFSVD